MASRDQSARAAAESLLTGSSSSQHMYPSIVQQQQQSRQVNLYSDQIFVRTPDTSHSINSPSLEFINEELLGGIRHNGQMSGVRRFFCLFLTFDLLFTFLMWLTCIMMIEKDITKALEDQVIHYNVHRSMFDVVMAAACRFTVLLLFYALLYINHWSIIALSTSGTCGFLIYKVFVFEWSTAPQPVFQVLIILTSFVLAWGETWFLDFRVIPQESLARNLVLERGLNQSILAGGGLIVNERSPLLGNFISNLARPDNYTESIGNFYSPLDSPRGSDSEDEGGYRRSSQASRLPTHLSSKDVLLQKDARETLTMAWALLNNNSGWKREKETDDGILVESRSIPKQRKIFRLMCSLDFAPRSLLNELFYKVEDVPSWNPTIIQSRRLQVLDEHTDVIYQVSAEGGNGVVSSREFVILRHWGVRDGAYILAGSSTTHPDAPEDKKLIRGHSGPNCWVMKANSDNANQCSFSWLLDTDLRGWVPQYMVETSLSGAMLDYIASLRKLSCRIREQGQSKRPQRL